MKFAILTVSLNAADFIRDNLQSVAMQNYEHIEHIVKDGGSTDGTQDIVRSSGENVSLIEQADGGIYEGMNQALAHTDADIVCYLNADDYFVDETVISDVAHIFEAHDVDYVAADIEFINDNGSVTRNWKVGRLDQKGLLFRQMPHPGFFVKTKILKALDEAFDQKFRIASDCKQQLLLIHKLNAQGVALGRVTTRMRMGGESTKNFRNIVLGWQETALAFNQVNRRFGWLFVFFKVVRKLSDFKWGSN